MPQRLGPDVIKALGYSAPNVQLPAGSRVTLGGQQYYLTSQLSVTLSGLTANTLYMVYAVLSGGVPALVYSTNVNSVGPVGYSVWKLVGAFYSNGLGSVAFGSFVNIDGSPVTEEIPFLMTIGATTTPPTKGTVAVDSARYIRNGNGILIRYDYKQTTTGSAGSGNYLFPLAGFTVDTVTQEVGNRRSIVGFGHLSNVSDFASSATVPAVCWLLNSSNIAVDLWSSSAGVMNDNKSEFGAGSFALSGANIGCSFSTTFIPISGWSNTPLKDL